MEEINIFEKATRVGLRFDTGVGSLTTEDLWRLPLTSSTKVNLNDIAKSLHSQLKEADGEISFVEPVERNDAMLQLSFSVVKRVIEVLVGERDAAKAASEKRAKKQKIMELIAKKQDEQLSNSSMEDLQAMLDAV